MLNNVAGFCESLEDLNKLGGGGRRLGRDKEEEKGKGNREISPGINLQPGSQFP